MYLMFNHTAAATTLSGCLLLVRHPLALPPPLSLENKYLIMNQVLDMKNLIHISNFVKQCLNVHWRTCAYRFDSAS